MWFEGDASDAQSPRPPSVGHELLHFGTDHLALGVEIARAWQLPKNLAFVIQRQGRLLTRATTPDALIALSVTAGAAATERLYGAGSGANRDPGKTSPLENVLKVLARHYERDVPELERFLQSKEDEVRELVGKIVSG